MEETVVKRSLIKKYFSDEVYIELLKVTYIPNSDNNEKALLVKDILTKYNIPFSGLGSGTNRMAVLIDGYAVKIALDDMGKIDNKREFKYSKNLQPYVIKVYECVPSGLIAVTEFVNYFTLDDFNKNQDQMREILADISENYLIGDVGLTKKNYVNWGIRTDNTICILDFAYIYSVSYNTFICDDDGSILRYDDNYVNLICPTCGRKYSFGEIRKRITRSQQKKEIGNIREYGYNIHHDNESVKKIKEFEPVKDTGKKTKKLSEEKENEKIIKEYKEREKTMSKKHNEEQNYEDELDLLMSLDSFIYGNNKEVPDELISNGPVQKKEEGSIFNQLNKGMKSSNSTDMNNLVKKVDNEDEEDDEVIDDVLDSVMSSSSDIDITEDNDKLDSDTDESVDDMIEEDISDLHKEEIDDINDSSDINVKPENVVNENDESDEEYNDNDSYYYYSRVIEFGVEDINLGKAVINDGIAPVTYSLTYGLDQEYNAKNNVLKKDYTKEELNEIYSQLIDYIVSLKFPTAVFKRSDTDKVKPLIKATSYNPVKYKFFTTDKYMLCYEVDDESLNDLFETFKDEGYDEYDIMGSFVGIAYACGTLNNAFFNDDDAIVDNMYNSDCNLQDEFIDSFENDRDTLYDDDSSSGAIELYSFINIQKEGRELIGKITGNSYYNISSDDDDDEDIDDDEDTDDDINDENTEEYDDNTSDDSDNTSEDSEDSEESDDLMSNEMESVDLGKVQDNDGGIMTTEVIRKQ